MADSYGIKVAAPGKKINSTNDNDFTLKSNFNMLKVAKSDSIYLTNSQGTFNSISHGLPYIPQFLAFTTNSSNVYLASTWDGLFISKINNNELGIFNPNVVHDKAYYYIFYQPIE